MHDINPPRARPRASPGWRVRLATTIVGTAASLLLLGWVGWWALTTSLAAPHFPLPGVIAFIILVTWGLACWTVGRHPLLACALFVAAGATVVPAASVLPQPELLLGASAGLAAWALLGWLADAPGLKRWPGAAARAPGRVWSVVPRRTAMPAPRCIICHLEEAGPEGTCAECGRWVRAHPDEWTDTGRAGTLPYHQRPRSAPAGRQPGTDPAPGVDPRRTGAYPGRPPGNETGRGGADPP
jgi:hypothetical protein